MRVPISWLKEYVDVDLSPTELDSLLTNAGMEGVGLDIVGLEGADLVWDRELVLLAQVVKVDRHPEADKLVLATVEYGAGEPKVVVTGAPNLFPLLDQGDLTDRRLFSPMVLEGATYLDPYKDLKPRRLKGKPLRGIYNDAMLCSPVELGLGEDHDGILLIEEDEFRTYVAGTPLQDVLGDAVLDIDVIPNIARCASIIGIAREVAALTGAELRLPSLDVQMDGPPIDGRVEIHTEHPEFNPRFVVMVIEGVEQKPSPFWMQHRLRLAGQRPINVVVDISNYVLLELGQPNHTFDYDFLRGRADRYAPDGPIRLVTRLAHEGETLTTLDGVEHKLRSNNILVTDPEGNLSVGGIMGGHDSEIRPETTNVLLEAAAWNFINIRQTQRQLAMHTEAGFRFSRGVHPAQAERGARRVAELLRVLAGGTVAKGIVDYRPMNIEPVVVDLDVAYVRRLSGLNDLDGPQVADLLRRLEFEVEGSGDSLRVTAPDHRIDIEGPHDLVEEVCRIYGYDRIPMTVLADSLPPQRGNPSLEAEEKVKDILVELGLHEAITYRLTTPEAESKLSGELDETPYVRLANPSTQDRAVMRHSLLASVLEVAAANSRFRRRLALFEVGNVFPLAEGHSRPSEPARLALVAGGPRNPQHWQGDDEAMMDFFDLKGTVESLGEGLGAEFHFESAEAAGFRPGRTARIHLADGTVLGVLGELHPLTVERYEFRTEKDQPVLAAELDLEVLLARVSGVPSIDPVPVYPAIREDLALVVDVGLSAGQVREALQEAGAPLLVEVELFDVYQGEHVAEGKKSLAYHLTFQSRSKTLKDKDVQKQRRRILGTLEKTVGAILR